jgi:glycosyltransferase involved in cell wall biosynthesis
MTTQSDFSIVAIIPLYNGARWIEQAIASVVTQTRQPDEFIVVDDGSTDNGAGAAIVEQMAQEHPFIRLVRKPNGGQSSARNCGVAHSNSALIAPLDQDDIWYPTHLETLIKPFCERRHVPLGWVYSNVDLVAEDGRLVVRNYLRDVPAEHPKRHLTRCLSEDMHVLPGASLISRAAFEAIGGFDERLSGYEDDDLFLRLFVANYDNVFIDEALSQWRMVQSSSGHSLRMLASGMIYMDKLLKAFPDDEACGHRYARDFIAPRFFKTALVYFGQALRRHNAQQRREIAEDFRRILPHLRRRIKIPLQLMLLLMRSSLGGWTLLLTRPLLVRIYRAVLPLNEQAR